MLPFLLPSVFIYKVVFVPRGPQPRLRLALCRTDVRAPPGPHTPPQLTEPTDPKVVAECKALYEVVLKSTSRNADAWVTFTKLQYESSGSAADAAASLAKYPPPLGNGANPTESDGIVHNEIVRYMMLRAGVDPDQVCETNQPSRNKPTVDH